MLIFYQTAQKRGMMASFSQRTKRSFTFRELEANFGVLVSIACGYAALQTLWFHFPYSKISPIQYSKIIAGLAMLAKVQPTLFLFIAHPQAHGTIQNFQ